jgi:glycosyltransferase involved in cell wall biosynthesis
MKRIAFIDCAHHRETKSSKFLIDFFSPFFDIDIYWDESKMGGSLPDATSIEQKNYDIVFILQAGTNLNFYSQIDCRSIVVIPNFIPNHFSIDNDFPEKFKYLVLSKSQHKVLAALGRNSAWFQYYSNPYDFTPIKNYDPLKGFHWCRSPEVSKSMIHELIADAKFAGLHIHDASIPGERALIPAGAPATNINVTSSVWHKDRGEYLRILSNANVFFAPRLYEFPPHTILEAMSMGMCVVAPNLPSTNEYIENGKNGLLYDPNNLFPLDFTNLKALGQNARKSMEDGFDGWLDQRHALFEYLTGTPLDQWDWSKSIAPQFTLETVVSECIPLRNVQKKTAKSHHLEGGKGPGNHEQKAPLLTVATVVQNSESNLEETIKSVLGQTYDGFEYIIIDGMSSDGTIDIIKKYDCFLDRWVSEQDDGPYQAMAKAVKLARGDYIIFMNAGDWFASPQVIERIFANLSEKPDIVYGDHIWLKNGAPQFHKSLPFSAIIALLRQGKNSTAHWYHGLPNHQSTFIKTALLRKRPYDTKYHIAADYDFLFDTACKGGRFLQVDLLISVYQAGGMSSKNEQLCHKEWSQIFSKYGNKYKDQAVYSGFEHHDFTQNAPRPFFLRREFFPSPRKESLFQGISGRLAALATVNECARVYLTTPCLNAIDTIDQTILSVVSQCGDNFALRYHVQDGGSTDGTVERLKEWERILSSSNHANPLEKRKNVIFSYASKPDSGMYEAITRGFDCMEIPSTAILSWINADDILFQGAIATLVKVFKKYDQTQWVTGHNCLFSSNLEVIGYNNEATPSSYIQSGFCEGLNWRFVQQEGTFFRKWLWDIVGGFDLNLKYAADWDLWRRFAEHAELVHFPGPLAAFRLRRGQISANQNNYMGEIDSVVPSADRSKAAKRLTAEGGKNLQIASICFRNNQYELENRPLSSFRIPHAGRKLFKSTFPQEIKKENPRPLNNSEPLPPCPSPPSSKFTLRLWKWFQSVKLHKSGLFYERYYADQVANLPKPKMALVEHYLLHGGFEGKDPNPMFSSSFYLSQYNDVYLSDINPLLHYILHGWKEGRDPHAEFSTNRYLNDYEDVRKSSMNPLLHYLLHGILEGRKIYPGA